MRRQTLKARYPFPDLNVLPEDIRARILEVQEKDESLESYFVSLVGGGSNA